MCRMRVAAKSIQHNCLHTTHLLSDVVWYLLTINHVSQALLAVLAEQEPGTAMRAVRQGQWGDPKITHVKRSVYNVRFGNEIPFGPGSSMKGVGENPPQILHRGLVSIHRQPLVTAQVAKAPAIIQAHDMVSMRMSEKHGVQPADVFAQHLNAKFRRCIYHDFSFAAFYVNRGPGAMVFWIGEKLWRIFLADDRHALRSSRT